MAETEVPSAKGSGFLAALLSAIWRNPAPLTPEQARILASIRFPCC